MKGLSKYIFCYVLLSVLHKTVSLSISNPFDCKVPESSATLYLIQNGQMNKITNATMLKPKVTTYFMVHGGFDGSSGVEQNISRALEFKGNSILIDYSTLLENFNLNCVDKIVLTLGGLLTDFIVNATTKGQLKPENTYLIGQSEGAHVVGYVGRTVQIRTNQRIQRITGLDPARIDNSLPFNYLKSTDAEWVDVIHTDMGEYDESAELVKTMGTVYVNAKRSLGTNTQKECFFNENILCNYIMSQLYYLESINSCGIIAKRVGGKDTAVVGFHMPVTTKGSFEFTANQNSPYGSGDPKC